MSHKHSASLVAIIIVSLMLLPMAAGAQTVGQSKVLINQFPDPQQVTTTAGAVGLLLQPAFTLVNADNQVLPSPQIVDGTIDLGNASYKADVQELNTPWYIVVVFDGSKTMGTFSASADFKSAKTDLANAIGGVPDKSNVSVIDFADNAPTVLDFTQAKDQVGAKIKNLTARASGNSCLNSALFQAVNNLSPANGRRAIILFTASGDNCADKSAQDVVTQAKNNNVEIYAVGLNGYAVTQNELDALTNPTGGFAELQDSNGLEFAFSNITAVLNSQWTAKSTVYPSAGQQTGTLTINLKDGTSIQSAPFSFTSDQDYIPPAEIHLKGTVQSTGNGIIFNLDISQPQKIRQLNVTIVSKDTGQSVLSQALLNFSDVNNIPAVSLSPGLDYTLTVVAVDSNGKTLSQDSADFTYQPPQAAVTITDVQTPTASSNHFQVTVSSQNVSGAVKYKAWLEDQQSETKLNGTEVTVPLGDPILIPANGVGSGTYSVVVQALDSTDTVLAESAPFKLNYQSIGLFARFRQWVSSSPLAIAGMTGVCCLSVLGILGVVWLVVPKRREAKSGVDLVMPEGQRRQAPASPRPGRPIAPPRAEPPAAPPRPAPPRAAPPPAAPQAPAGAPPVATTPLATITLRFPAEPAFSTMMRHTPFTVGRRKDNDAPLPVDSSSGVSGHHLQIIFERGAYFVLDESSKFGTSINGKPVTKGEPTQIKHGDRIGLGPIVKIEFSLPAGQ